jgi:hypothetical protein
MHRGTHTAPSNAQHTPPSTLVSPQPHHTRMLRETCAQLPLTGQLHSKEAYQTALHPTHTWTASLQATATAAKHNDRRTAARHQAAAHWLYLHTLRATLAACSVEISASTALQSVCVQLRACRLTHYSRPTDKPCMLQPRPQYQRGTKACCHKANRHTNVPAVPAQACRIRQSIPTAAASAATRAVKHTCRAQPTHLDSHLLPCGIAYPYAANGCTCRWLQIAAHAGSWVQLLHCCPTTSLPSCAGRR